LVRVCIEQIEAAAPCCVWFDEVDKLLPKIIILEPLSLAMKMTRQYHLKSPDLEKTFQKGVKKFKDEKGVLIYSLYAWILVKKKEIDNDVSNEEEAENRTENENENPHQHQIEEFEQEKFEMDIEKHVHRLRKFKNGVLSITLKEEIKASVNGILREFHKGTVEITKWEKKINKQSGK